METFDVGQGSHVQWPTVQSIGLNGRIKLQSGQEVSVPFGMESGASQKSHYTLQLTASTIKS